MIVEAERLALSSTGEPTSHRYLTNRGFFKFVSLDQSGKTIEIPPMVIATREEYIRFMQGQRRYDKSKALRQAKDKENLKADNQQ